MVFLLLSVVVIIKLFKTELSLLSSNVFYSDYYKSKPKWWGTLRKSEIYFTHESYTFIPVLVIF